LSGIKIVSVLNQVANNAVGSKDAIRIMSVEINKLHNILDHCGETHLKAIANEYGIKVFGKLEACESYAIQYGKAIENQQVVD
jgi:hypothetical protein